MEYMEKRLNGKIQTYVHISIHYSISTPEFTEYNKLTELEGS